MIFRHKFFLVCMLIMGFILIYVSSPVMAEKPDPVQLLTELNKKPFYEHGPGDIYFRILQDTSVLEHAGLVNRLLEIGRDGWLKQYLLPLRFDDPQENPEWFNRRGLSRAVLEFQRILSLIPNETQGHRALELKMYFLGNSVGWNNQINRQIKKDVHTLRILVKEGDYVEYGARKKEELISGGGDVDQAIYESYRFNKNHLKKPMQEKIIGWAWEVVRKSKLLTLLKKTAIAILLDEGVSENEIITKYKHDIEYLRPKDSPWTFTQIRDNDLRDAKEFRSEYPKWPVDESTIDDDSHRNDKGKGHDKQKGEDH